MKDLEPLAQVILANWCLAGIVKPRVEEPRAVVEDQERERARCDVQSAFVLAEEFTREAESRRVIGEPPGFKHRT